MLLAKDLICLLYGWDRALLWVRKQRTSTMETADKYLQTFPAEILAAVVRGKVDLNGLCKAALAERRLNLEGEWIGFEEAKHQVV
jgi:hypothetical protein